ncbi:MAG: proteasome-activating nucleotidase [Candidatus Hodarchaeales archaeon]
MSSRDDRKRPAFSDEFPDSHTRSLERRVRVLETEKQLLEAERIKMERELNSIRIELERLRTPPLFSGSILELLDQGRVIVKSSTGPTFVVQVAGRIPTEELISGARVGLNQRSFAVMEVLPPSRDPLVRGMEVDERPDVSYGDIGGLDEQLLEIQETVELPLLQPELFEEVGVDPPKGVLLHGPPGTGKTLLARAVANETQATFIRVIGSELVQKYIGEGARLVREVFQFAREKGPSILFIDELDAIGSKRLDIATSGDREVQRTLMQLLSELDGFSPRGDVKVIGATNRIDILDVALLRAGRFDRHIEIPTPDSSARRAIFEIHSRPMNLSKDINYDILAGRTEGMSGADIKTICTEAGMFTIRDKRNMITHRDFLKAIEKLLQKRQQTEKAMNLYL